MRSTQEKFFVRVDQIASDLGLEAVVDKTYGNVGSVSIERRDVLEPLLTFGFNFQSGYASFTAPELVRPSGNRWSYVRRTELEKFLDALRERLEELIASA